MNAISHFLVDAACVCALYSSARGSGAEAACVLLYNTFAFSTQCVAGLLFDMLRMPERRAARGGLRRSAGPDLRFYGYLEAAAMLLVAVFALLPLPPVLKVILIGLGNSVFHVCGGTVTLRRSRGKAASLGVFVAPGAFGVTLGTLLPSASVWVSCCLGVFAVLCFVVYRGADPDGGAERPTAIPRDTGVLLPAALLTAAVAVRAIGGCAASFTWKDGAADAVLLTLFVFLGKALGGFACDRLGASRMSAVTVALAAVFTAFFARSMPLSLAGQFLLNLSMPVTLWLMYKLLPDLPGFAFGLTASALWPGTIAGWMIQLTGAAQSALILLCFIISLGAIIYTDRFCHKKARHAETQPEEER